MSSNISKLIRENIKKLQPYQSARRIGGNNGGIFLNANESSISIFFKNTTESLNRYPEAQPNNLISAYSNYVSLPSDQILVTRGADEGIELLIKAFCEPGKDSIIYCPPTYDMYGINARILNVEIKEIPTIKETWQLDLFKIKLNLNTVKLIYICNPNNPTGNIINKRDLIYLLKLTLGLALIVVDEAYIEFSPKDSMIHYLKKYPNLIILRTLSKAFALAGIRCGFTLANKEIIETLNKVIAPYPIPVPVLDIAVQSLQKNYITIMKNRVLDIVSNRLWLISQLKQIFCVEKVFNSNSNYVLVKFFISKEIFQFLWEKGIILRDQSTKINLKECLRISIGTRKECSLLIKELKYLSKKYLYSIGYENEK